MDKGAWWATVYLWGHKESDMSWQLNHPLQEWSLFPPGLWKSCNQILLAFKVRFPGDPQSLCWTPRLGSLTWGAQKPSQQWENFCGLVVLQFVCCPPGGYGIWFYCDCAPPPVWLRLLLCFWTWGMFLLVDSSIVLSMVIQQLVGILVFSQEAMSARPSTLPSWTNLHCYFFF